jgi:hypothetical protein
MTRISTPAAGPRGAGPPCPSPSRRRRYGAGRSAVPKVRRCDCDSDVGRAARPVRGPPRTARRVPCCFARFGAARTRVKIGWAGRPLVMSESRRPSLPATPGRGPAQLLLGTREPVDLGPRLCSGAGGDGHVQRALLDVTRTADHGVRLPSESRAAPVRPLTPTRCRRLPANECMCVRLIGIRWRAHMGVSGQPPRGIPRGGLHPAASVERCGLPPALRASTRIRTHRGQPRRHGARRVGRRRKRAA